MDYLPKEPAILVSSVNMLLRDEEFDSLESFCYAFSRETKEIKDMPTIPSISRKPSWYWFARSYINLNCRKVDFSIKKPSTRIIPNH